MNDPKLKQTMIRIAEAYEKLARHMDDMVDKVRERRARRKPPVLTSCSSPHLVRSLRRATSDVCQCFIASTEQPGRWRLRVTCHS